MLDISLRIYKNGEININAPKGGKRTILAIDSKYCVIKENGHSGYVHRGVGNQYTPPTFYIYEINKIKRYKDFIDVNLKQLWSQEAAKEYIDSFIDLVSDMVPEETYNPLARYSSAERKQIEEHLKRQEEIMKQFNEALDKHKE